MIHMDSFKIIHNSLLEDQNFLLSRELLNQIDWSHRLICIKGFRGVGKTSFILDHIKKVYPGDDSVLFINLNNFYFTKRKIYSFADEFAKLGGKVLFLDQIQKYPDWSAELRMCYDEIPDLKIVFTSSPVLRVAEDNPDLEGIARIYHLEGLSFREFLNYKTGQEFPVYKLEDILNNHVQISKEIVSKVKPLAYFGPYLQNGYFPYFMNESSFFTVKLLKNINLALEIDVPYLNQIELKYLSKLRKLLYIIATETPVTPNVSKLAAAVETSRATIMNYLKYLKNARLINLLYSNGNGEPDQMKKPDKVYMHNTNLQYAIAPENADSINLRHTFFLNQVGYKHKLESTPGADFLVDKKYKFIVGGRKTLPENGKYGASDMIETGLGNKIPLWLFGFLY
ncbi:MAG: ATP-binding protein [Prolixibacteraceae bacterium]|nr:ATP-binding protein [Prolixibacteraceae bacterium]MBN2775185.1 ATP-binding protein [Prolixibacteraceae bacterium]